MAIQKYPRQRFIRLSSHSCACFFSLLDEKRKNQKPLPTLSFAYSFFTQSEVGYLQLDFWAYNFFSGS